MPQPEPRITPRTRWRRRLRRDGPSARQLRERGSLALAGALLGLFVWGTSGSDIGRMDRDAAGICFVLMGIGVLGCYALRAFQRADRLSQESRSPTRAQRRVIPQRPRVPSTPSANQAVDPLSFREREVRHAPSARIQRRSALLWLVVAITLVILAPVAGEFGVLNGSVRGVACGLLLLLLAIYCVLRAHSAFAMARRRDDYERAQRSAATDVFE